MSRKCGECEDYYCCKSDSKLRGKYLPKNKKACRDFNPSRVQLEAENKRLREILAREVNDGRAEVDDIGVEAWIEQALKG